MTSEIEREPDAAKVALWRDTWGFSRATETEPGSGVFFVIGADDLSHAVFCDFVQERGVLACSCDATRRPERSWWRRCWLQWMNARVSPYERRHRVPWPILGPDGEPWVEGRDFTGDAELTPGPAAPIGAPLMAGLVTTEWGVRDKLGVHPVHSGAAARRIVNSMKGAAIVWRGVTDWQEEDYLD